MHRNSLVICAAWVALLAFAPHAWSQSGGLNAAAQKALQADQKNYRTLSSRLVSVYERAGSFAEASCEEQSVRAEDVANTADNDAAKITANGAAPLCVHCVTPPEGQRKVEDWARTSRLHAKRLEIEKFKQEENQFFKNYIAYQASETACQQALLGRLLPSEDLSRSTLHDPDAKSARAAVARDVWRKALQIRKLDDQLDALQDPGSVGARGVGVSAGQLEARRKYLEKRQELETARETLQRSVFMGNDEAMRAFVNSVVAAQRARRPVSEAEFLVRADGFDARKDDALSFVTSVLQPMKEAAALRARELNADSRLDYSREVVERKALSRKIAYLKNTDALRSFLLSRQGDSQADSTPGSSLQLQACALEQAYKVGPEFVRGAAQTALFLAGTGAFVWAAKGASALEAAGSAGSRLEALLGAARTTSAGRGLLVGSAFTGIDAGDAFLSSCSSDRAKVGSVLSGDFCSAAGGKGSTTQLVTQSIDSRSCQAGLMFAAMGSLGLVGDIAKVGRLVRVGESSVSVGSILKIREDAIVPYGGYFKSGKAKLIGVDSRTGQLLVESQASNSGRVVAVTLDASAFHVPVSADRLTPGVRVKVDRAALRDQGSASLYFGDGEAEIVRVNSETGKVTLRSKPTPSGKIVYADVDLADLSLAPARVYLRNSETLPAVGDRAFISLMGSDGQPQKVAVQVEEVLAGGKFRVRKFGPDGKLLLENHDVELIDFSRSGLPEANVAPAVSVAPAQASAPMRVIVPHQKLGENETVFTDRIGQVEVSGYLRPKLNQPNTRVNQDAVAVFEGKHGPVVVSADGMGGYRGGEIAAQAVVDEMRVGLQSGRSIGESMKAAGARIQQAIGQGHADKSAGATVAMAEAMEGGKVRLTSIGDARAAHFRAGVIVDRTKDQSPMQALIDAGAITPEKALSHQFNNITDNAVMSMGVENLEKVSQVVVAPKAGDFIVVGSDGLWDNLTTEEVARILAPAKTQREAYQLLTEALRKATRKNDDINYVVMKY